MDVRLTIHDFGGYPFSAQLARTLARRGHTVTYLHADGLKAPRASLTRRHDDSPLLRVEGIRVDTTYRAGAGVRRLLQERDYGRRLAQAIARASPDAVISANCPLDAQLAAMTAAHRAGSGFVFWLQDIYSAAVTRLLRKRLGPLGGVIGRRFARLERRVLSESEAIVAIADEFLDMLRGWGIPSQRISVIENWAPLDEIPMLPRMNPWAAAQGINHRGALLYAGTLGRKHDPTTLIELARKLPDARVVVVADGVGAERLRRDATVPPNLLLLPIQEPTVVPMMMASADVLVALLDPEAHAFSVPSKVLTYLAAGRPIIAAMPAENLAARIVMENDAGVVIDPTNTSAIIDAARDLLADEALRERYGAKGRAYAERTFGAEAKADAFEAVLQMRAGYTRIGANAGPW